MLSAASESTQHGVPIPDYDETVATMRPNSTLDNRDCDEDALTKGLEHEQQLSLQLEAISSHLNGKFASRLEPVEDQSMSPAAIFLSSFSPTLSEAASRSDSEGDIISGYQLGPVIAVGGSSVIRQATSSQGGTVAVKIVRRSDLDKQADAVLARKRLDREAAVWSTLSHEHILPLFSVYRTPNADYFFTLYCPAGSLFDILKRDGRPALPQDEAGMMFRQVVRGLRYLHEVAGIVHGDMKLENVLVDEMGVCRISDFGMARKIGEIHEEQTQSNVHKVHKTRLGAHSRIPHRKQGHLSSHLSMIRHEGGSRHRNSSPLPISSSVESTPSNYDYNPGSLPYAAPELLLPSSSAPRSPNPAQDIWALGVMLYALLTGRLPFVDSYDPRLQMKILHGVFDMPKGIGRGAESVLQGCLERSVPSRWTIAMVDEVAWGIGWGEEGDSATPPESRCTPPRVASSSRSRSRPGVQLDTAAIDDAESVRSSSLATCSGNRSLSVRPRRSRSSSRHPHHPYEIHHHIHPHPHPHPRPTEPSFSALTNAILRTNSTSSDSSSSPNDSAVLMTPSSSQESERRRGRSSQMKLPWSSQQHAPDSRSVSPLEALLTPRDQSELEYHSMHPWDKNTDAIDVSGQGGEAFNGMQDAVLAEIDAESIVEDEDTQWDEGLNVEHRSTFSRPSARHRSRSLDDRRRKLRAGSMPPAAARSTSWRSSYPPSSHSSEYSSASTPKPISRKSRSGRSQSVDLAFD
ncbi:kinase-like protein [Laetiporus sulphureus 93-53]|uniref:Kinase-like protein n=1 Tax=Laetiporus sulphureus 93-53 TaxID=1314785 RepID=A0A165HW84_9APHY|nr:kinase-like protein [Laetiporus sulphureus 93-53]KZT12272.1 kinase-like protein [Laetiporus sulphureus 93-53]